MRSLCPVYYVDIRSEWKSKKAPSASTTFALSQEGNIVEDTSKALVLS